jgi:hypothetical protein
MKPTTARLTLGLCLALAAGPGCKGNSAGRESGPRPGVVVGQVLRVQGQATYRTPGGSATALKVGDLVRAEWTLRTAAAAHVTLLLRNGHEWRMGEDLEKRAGALAALRQPAVKRGALDRLDAFGSPTEIDRASAAGTYQERSAGTKAMVTRSFTGGAAQDKSATDTVTTREAKNQRRQAPDPAKVPTTDLRPPDQEAPVTAPASPRTLTELTRQAPTFGQALGRLLPFLKRCLLQDGLEKTQTVELDVSGVTGKVERAAVGGRAVKSGSCVDAVLGAAHFPAFPEAGKLVTFEVTIP